MEKFKTHRGKIALLDNANVDTDQIIAKQFLKSIKRTGFGEHLFHDWQYLEDGSPNPDFALNQPKFKNASILVARNNFGCGSSREHAVWAVQQAGYAGVIAPWKKAEDGSRIPAFADIFRNNSGKNGLLTIELSEEEVNQIFEAGNAASEGLEMTLDLENQKIILHAAEDTLTFAFEIDPAVKDRLIKGLDDIGITLEHESSITAFEKNHHPQL
ncbi:MAG: 3-isopropylmalate dehydratase small subunit [Candidatus Omnitrophica bacterium]|nr:3-isopropylmalate dehydratase small subunit [Candidatus Omnitrophota bacterium]